MIINEMKLKKLLDDSSIEDYEYDIFESEDEAKIYISGDDKSVHPYNKRGDGWWKEWNYGHVSFMFIIHKDGTITDMYFMSADTENMLDRQYDERDDDEILNEINEFVKANSKEVLCNTFYLNVDSNIIIDPVNEVIEVLKKRSSNYSNFIIKADGKCKVIVSTDNIEKVFEIAYNVSTNEWIVLYNFTEHTYKGKDEYLPWALSYAIGLCQDKYEDAIAAYNNLF